MTRVLDAVESSSEAGTRWCAGLPCVAEERLTELQRQAAERVYARARNAALAYAVSGGVVLPSGLALYLWATNATNGRGWIGLTLAFTLFAALVPVCIAKGLDHTRAALPLRRDLADGFLWVFEGKLAQARYEEEDPEVLALLDAGLFERGEREQRIGVLPRSGQLMQVNGQNVPPVRRLHVATTAPWPAQLFRYSLPPEVKDVFGTSAQGLKRRRMAEPECAELSRHIARLTAIPWLLIALTAVMSTFVSLWIVRAQSALQDLLAPAWIAVWGFAALRQVRGYALARRLEADLDVGWLLSWEATEPAAPPDPRDAPGPPPFQRAEVLPVSQRDWTIDGKPAAWRRVLSRIR